MDTIFSLPADGIGFEDVEQLVRLVPRESTTVEYKEHWESQHVKTIAAFANTHGGVMLIGVKNKDEPGRIVGVPAEEELKIVNACQDVLEPPFQPEILPVSFPDGRVVLIVRVYPELAPRPVICNGSIPIRLHGKTQPADIDRMRALFAETSVGGNGLELMTFQRPLCDLTGLHDNNSPTLTASFRMTVLLQRHRPLRFLDAEPRLELRNAIANSPLNYWLRRFFIDHNEPKISDTLWVESGQRNRLRTVIAASGTVAPNQLAAQSQLVVELGATHLNLGLSTFFVNTAFSPSTLTLEDLFWLIDASLTTLWVTLPQEALVNLIAPIPWRPTAPSMIIQCHDSKGLAQFLHLQPPPADPNLLYGDTPFDTGEPIKVDDENQRHALVVSWIRQLLLDLKIDNVEQHIKEVEH